MKLRKVEVFKKGMWQSTPFHMLTKGDIFRLFEPDGESVTDRDGTNKWQAVSDRAYDNGTTFEIECVPIKTVTAA